MDRSERVEREAKLLLARPDPYPPPPTTEAVLRRWRDDWISELRAMDELAVSVHRRRRALVARLKACHVAIEGTGLIRDARIFWPHAFVEPKSVPTAPLRELRGEPLRREVLDLLRLHGPLTAGEIASALQAVGVTAGPRPSRTVSDVLRVALRRDEVQRDLRGRYVCPDVRSDPMGLSARAARSSAASL